MDQIILWLKEYSPPVALLLMIGIAAAYFLKLVIEKQIDKSFQAANRRIELLLARRSAFEEKVLTQRYSLITELSGRMHEILIELERASKGQGLSPDIYRNGELLPMTRVDQDLRVNRLALTESFYNLLREKYEVLEIAIKALQDAANAEDPAAARSRIAIQVDKVDARLRDEADRVFGISKISWVEPS